MLLLLYTCKIPVSLQKTVTGLRQQIEELERSLLQARQEAEEKSTQFDRVERELSLQVEQLSTEKSKYEQEKMESEKQLKKAQQVVQTKEKVSSDRPKLQPLAI